MRVSVNIQTVHPGRLAAVRPEVAPGAVGAAWGPALGKVWPFIRSQARGPTATTFFLYHYPAHPGAPILCDFGVEVTRTLKLPARCTRLKHRRTRLPSRSTAAGTTAWTRRRTLYEDGWRPTAGSPLATREIYGDPVLGPVDTETTVVYLP